MDDPDDIENNVADVTEFDKEREQLPFPPARKGKGRGGRRGGTRGKKRPEPLWDDSPPSPVRRRRNKFSDSDYGDSPEEDEKDELYDGDYECKSSAPVQVRQRSERLSQKTVGVPGDSSDVDLDVFLEEQSDQEVEHVSRCITPDIIGGPIVLPEQREKIVQTVLAERTVTKPDGEKIIEYFVKFFFL